MAKRKPVELVSPTGTAGTELRRLMARYAGQGPVSMFLTVTPEIAADALSQNSNNRPVRTRQREFLANQILAGRWQTTHQGLAFSDDGKLLDGQHRLLAITDARQPVEVLVTFNVPREAFSVIDYGSIPRTLSDVTGIDRKALEPVRFIYNECVEKGKTYKTALEDFVPYWTTFGQTSTDLLIFCQKSRRVMSSAPIRAAAIYVAKVTGDDTAAFMAYRSLVMQEYNAMPKAVQSLNRQLITDDIRFPTERFVRAALAFERQDLGKLQVRDVLEKAAGYRAKIRALVLAHHNQIWKIKKEGKKEEKKVEEG